MALKGKCPSKARPMRPRMAVFGPAGIGKTWGALQWPNSYLIDTEGGASLPHYTEKLQEVGALYLGVEDGANDFGTVLREVNILTKEKHDRKTLIIDSFTKLFQTAVQVEADRMTAAGDKVAFASDRRPAVSMSRQLVRRFDALDMNVILICHEKGEWQGGEEIGRTFDGWDKLGYEFNLVVQVCKTGAARKARVIKSRYDTFNEGELVNWTYEEFAKRLGGSAVTEAVAKPAKMATDDQVARITELCKVLRVDASDVAKVLESAGANTWSELTFDRIAAAIKKLEKQIGVTNAA